MCRTFHILWNLTVLKVIITIALPYAALILCCVLSFYFRLVNIPLVCFRSILFFCQKQQLIVRALSASVYSLPTSDDARVTLPTTSFQTSELPLESHLQLSCHPSWQQLLKKKSLGSVDFCRVRDHMGVYSTRTLADTSSQADCLEITICGRHEELL